MPLLKLIPRMCHYLSRYYLLPMFFPARGNEKNMWMFFSSLIKIKCQRTEIEYGFMFFTNYERSCRKIMFSLVSVCLFTRGIPIWPLPMIHWTSLYSTPGPSHPKTSDMEPPGPAPCISKPQPHSLLVTSGGHHWRFVQNCSFEDHLVVVGKHANTYTTGMLSC